MTTPPACLTGRCGPVRFNGRSLRAVPEAVATARAFVPLTLGPLAVLDPDHAADVALVVDELVTNAIEHARGIRNAWLELEVWPLWTLVTVDDRDPAVHAPRHDPYDESGRGLQIVEALAERFWWHSKLISKTANAAILRSDVKLLPSDRLLLDSLKPADPTEDAL